jgi:hypothetical protein
MYYKNIEINKKSGIMPPNGLLVSWSGARSVLFEEKSPLKIVILKYISHI